MIVARRFDDGAWLWHDRSQVIHGRPIYAYGSVCSRTILIAEQRPFSTESSVESQSADQWAASVVTRPATFDRRKCAPVSCHSGCAVHYSKTSSDYLENSHRPARPL